MKFILFTKTLWSEVPRLRHQLARMLVKRGHEVVFFEKNSCLIRKRWRMDGIALRRHPELLHHQLRPFRSLSNANAAFEKAEIRRMVGDIVNATIINFNYDYAFLRSIFPRNAIITILNDDFLASAKPWMKHAARRVLAATVRTADCNLAVSYPLLNQVRQFTTNVALFLPWTRREYSRPQEGTKRDEMLYWGYINYRIDTDAVRQVMDAGIKINFVGPVQNSPGIRDMLAHKNAKYHGVADLANCGRWLGSCTCSIIPFNASDPRVAAITVSNRAFQLLSYGLPLLYAQLPYLIAAPANVIYLCATGEDYVQAFEQAQAHFWESQAAIASFLAGHSEETRYRQLMAHVDWAWRQRHALEDMEMWEGDWEMWEDARAAMIEKGRQ